MPQAKRSGPGPDGSKTRKSSSGRASASSSSASGDEDLRRSFAAFREFVQRAMEGQRHLVMLSSERIQEVMDDAVERGRVTRDDAEELVQEMVRRGRQQTTDVLTELEQLADRGRDQLETAATAARRSPPADRVLREVDRARRAAGIGQAFPILAYDDLTAAQVAERLADLSPAQLRKVRDYERRHGNRKSVLSAIEAKLV
jgi:polyhydroxyalkanoate synthesis regulator phasin